MPRRKILPDAKVLEAALALMHGRGPEALTFAALAEASGLSPATLVQRWGSKAALKQAALLLAWDQLDERTASLVNAVPRTPDGAVALLVGLSRNYGDIERYAEGLLVLREDLRDPALRARGAAWRDALAAAVTDCFTSETHAPADIGLLLIAQWQGSLLWWSFDPRGRIERHVEQSLQRFVAALLSR